MSIPSINVLLVEDDPTDALLVRAALGAMLDAGFEVVTVDHLDAAVRHAKYEPFDVILLDLGLPDSQGIESFEHLHSAAPEIPIIVLSGLGDDEIALQAVQQGGQDYLPKGQGIGELLPRAIRYAIERHRAQMERARYATILKKKNASLEEEFRMAREIQQALLPHHYPEFLTHQVNALGFAHFYYPAATLNGDFFIVQRLSDHQAGVLICDVMGHGVRAALIGALTRGLIDQFIPIATQPGKFLSALNHGLSETLKQAEIDAFATAFYFVADLQKREVTYANAGHPSAMLLQRDAGTANWLCVRGNSYPPLGLLGDAEYPTFHSPLNSNDSIVLFTDGLYEAENSLGHPFGRERLLTAARRRLQTPSAKLLKELVQESQKFSGTEEFVDDVCLVAMDVMI